MRENRPYGSEGGGTELNRSSLPLFRQDVATRGSTSCEVPRPAVSPFKGASIPLVDLGHPRTSVKSLFFCDVRLSVDVENDVCWQDRQERIQQYKPHPKAYRHHD